MCRRYVPGVASRRYLCTVRLEDLPVAQRPVADQPASGHLELLRPGDGRALGEHFAAARVDHRLSARERVQRRHTGNRNVEPQREPTGRRKADPDAGEAARTGADDDAVELAGLEAGGAKKLVGRDEYEARLCVELVDRLAVADERTRRDRRGCVKGEDRSHWRS